MAHYTGVHCPVCDKKFTDEDDIVVCPVCGTPHHRACYQQEGRCAFEEQHIKGHTWEPSGRDTYTGQERTDHASSTACPSCGANNPPSGLFCQICGTPLRKTSDPAGQWQWQQPSQQPGPNPYASSNAYNASFGGLSPDDQINGISVRDLALYIGPNSHYFLPRFKQMSEHSGISFNFSAFLFHFVYFFYRKMYLAGTLLLLLAAMTFVPALFIAREYTIFVLENFSDISVGIMPVFEPVNHLWAYRLLPYTRMVMLGIMFLLALFANQLYMQHVFHKVAKIREHLGSTANDQIYTDSLVRCGRTSRVAVVLCLVGAAAAYFGSCLLIALTVLAGA